MIKVTTAWLQTVEELKDVPENQLQWLIDNSQSSMIPQGEFLFKPGTPITATYIIVDGKIRMYMLQNNVAREFTVIESKTITGHLPFSRGKVAGGYGEAMVDTQILSLSVDYTHDLICSHFELTQALVHVMTNRVRNFTAMQQQNEKMMALGKLSAGLAHELNNPASAVVRGAVSLKKHLKAVPESFKQIIEIRMNPDEIDIVNKKLFDVLDNKDKPTISLMERSALEDDLADWLQDNQVDNAFEIAENLVDFGFNKKDAEEFKQHIPKNYLSAIFGWINKNLVTEKMVTDIEDASKRIADLVGSVKTFTHMDQGNDKQFADIHTGIINTLKMLEYKARKGNVQIVENFDTSLPPVKAMIGELNQVWTNLIDNAFDAMETNGKGILEIKTERDREFVQVSIIDNGPGIPDEIRSQIFDPFFTTKAIGKGTGLGLDVVTRIVHQHRGSIKVTSVPGCTQFSVCFPING